MIINHACSFFQPLIYVNSSFRNLSHPDENPKIPWLTQVLENCSGKFVAASDFMKVLPASIARWVPGDLVCLGTDGYGLSESREALRDHFGISAKQIVNAVLGRVA